MLVFIMCIHVYIHYYIGWASTGPHGHHAGCHVMCIVGYPEVVCKGRLSGEVKVQNSLLATPSSEASSLIL